MKKTDWAYLSGFVDGEGCISSYQHRQGNGLYFISMLVTQVDPRPLLWARDTFEVGYVYVDRRGISRWRVTGHPLVPILRGMIPYLQVKREEAEAAILLMTSYRTAQGIIHQRFTHNLLKILKIDRHLNA